MQTIRLNRQAWTFDETDRLGPPGGFGEIFRGTGGPSSVAIKRLRLTAHAAAHREMNIGASLAERTLEHVVPVLDYGEDAESDRYYLVMPVCDMSLQDLLDRQGKLELGEAKAVALDVLAGLAEVGDLVHRDLKPGNILRYEGRWCVGDFGIAKFVEDSTSVQTLRESLTPLYGAPEQWLGERPTSATDVYAFGCIWHAMLNGNPPFTGSIEDVREAHLKSPPPPLSSGIPRLDGLVVHMLRKSAPSRPSIDRCNAVIQSIESAPAKRRSEALAAAGHRVAQEEAANEAAEREQATRDQERRELAEEAIRELWRILGTLFDEIEATTESARRHARAITLGSAHLMFDEVRSLAPSLGRTVLRDSIAEDGWDVVAYTSLSLRASDLPLSHRRSNSVYVWSASLVFASTPEERTYRWREIAFWSMFDSTDDRPYAVSPTDREFGIALSNIMGRTSVAYGPFAIDGEDKDDFLDRWLTLFARAAERALLPPDHMPIDPMEFRR